MKTGTIKWFNSEKGFGFIGVEGEKDVFIHSKSIQGNARTSGLNEGDRVEFEVEQGPKGLQAANVHKL